MDSSNIAAFVFSVRNVFATMLQLPLQIGEPAVKKAGSPSYDVSGIIGMSGDVDGTVVLSFPTTTAERVVSLFAGEDIAHSHADFPDAVGELVNMITGGAKARFAGKQVSVTCPSVVIGRNHLVFNRKDVTCVLIPCTCDCGEFAVEVAMRTAVTNGVSSQKAEVLTP